MNLMTLNAVAEIDVSATGAFSPERLALAGKMTLLGMLMIFSVLSLLWVIIAIFSRIMENSASKPVAVATPVPAPAPVQNTAPAVVESNDDETIAAVIAAAVAAYMSSEGYSKEVYNGGFRVVSFRRVEGGKAWNSKH